MSLRDREFVVWGGRFTKREFFGKPWELALGIVALFGPPLLMWYAMDAFPILDGSSRIYWIIPLPVLAVAWAVAIIYRRKIMPWGDKAPGLMWGGTLAVAVLPPMLALGATIFANGAFDSSESVEKQAEVTRRWGDEHKVRVAVADLPNISISLQLTRYEFYDIEIGDSVSLFVRSGAFAIP